MPPSRSTQAIRQETTQPAGEAGRRLDQPAEEQSLGGELNISPNLPTVRWQIGLSICFNK
jgi:hypothetical protein